MTTVQEIEAAIEKLAPEDRARLAESLPRLVPELDGDARWAEIIHDPTPRPTLTAFLDDIDARYRENPGLFPAMSDADFDKHE